MLPILSVAHHEGSTASHCLTTLESDICINMANTLITDKKEMEVIRIGSVSPVRYLPMTEFVDHDSYREDESDDRNYISSLYELEGE